MQKNSRPSIKLTKSRKNNADIEFKTTSQKLQNFLLNKIIRSFLFIVITTLLILANTVTLALDRYPISVNEVNKLEFANLIFTILFILEMVILLFGYGVK
jgi:hypothetical protein